MKKIKTTFLLILIIFCFTGLTSCDYVENNNDNIDKTIDYFYPVYVDVLFDSQLNSESTLKANLNYAYVSSVKNYTCEPPKRNLSIVLICLNYPY